MPKVWKIFLIVILVCILCLTFFRNNICRFLIFNTILKTTGLNIAIQDINLDFLNNSLQMRDISLYNPGSFREKILGRAKEIFIKYDLSALISGRMHLRQLKLNISEINIIRNENGESNIAYFKREWLGRKITNIEPSSKDFSSEKSLSEPKEPKEVKTERGPRLFIDRLELSLEKVTFVDYGASLGQPAVVVFTSKGHFVFKNVSNLNYVVNSVSTKEGFRNLLDKLLGIIPVDAVKTTTEAIKQRIQKRSLPKSK